MNYELKLKIEKLLRRGELKLKVFIIGVLILASMSCAKKDDNYSNQNSDSTISDTITLSSIKSKYNLKVDSTILKTDNFGNIWGGDRSDWNFDITNYNTFLNSNIDFREPLHKADPSVPMLSSFYSEFEGNELLLTWMTATEKNCEGFYVECAKKSFEYDKLTWEKIGFVKGHGNSDKLITYNFRDDNLKEGLYNYRIKQVFFDKEGEYYNLDNEVTWNDYPKYFQFYPVFPNPVYDKFDISFYLPIKSEVNLYFLNGKDTSYILDYEPQSHGFYKITLDKKSLGFENEIRRLYIDCESCGKNKNFGDVQF